VRTDRAPGSAEDWLSRAKGKLLLARQPLPEGVRESEKLTRFAVQMRYPGMSGATTQEEYADMIAIAETVVAWAESIVTQ